jgi:hypothetical protein
MVKTSLTHLERFISAKRLSIYQFQLNQKKRRAKLKNNSLLSRIVKIKNNNQRNNSNNSQLLSLRKHQNLKNLKLKKRHGKTSFQLLTLTFMSIKLYSPTVKIREKLSKFYGVNGTQMLSRFGLYTIKSTRVKECYFT